MALSKESKRIVQDVVNITRVSFSKKIKIKNKDKKPVVEMPLALAGIIAVGSPILVGVGAFFACSQGFRFDFDSDDSLT